MTEKEIEPLLPFLSNQFIILAKSKCQVLKGGPACGHGESETDFIERVDICQRTGNIKNMEGKTSIRRPIYNVLGKLTYYLEDGRKEELSLQQSFMVLPLITQGWCELYESTNGSEDIGKKERNE